MNNKTKVVSIALFLLAFSNCLLEIYAYQLPADQSTLADLYKKGTIRLIPEIVIDDSTLPEDAILEIPVDITCDSEGNVYVLDQKANNVKIFNSSGKYLRTIGRRGRGPGEFNAPHRFTFAKDRLVIWDQENYRICTISPEGEFLKSIKSSIMEAWPYKLRSLPNGDIIIERLKLSFTDKPHDFSIEIFSPDLKLKKVFYLNKVWPYKYSKTANKTLPAPFYFYIYWDITLDGKIVMGFSEKNEIEYHDPFGGILSSFSHPYEPVKLNEQDKKEFLDGITYVIDGRRAPYPDVYKKNTEFPKFKPAFFNILVDSQDNILVSRYRNNRHEDYRSFDVFNSDGNFINTVQFLGISSFPKNFYLVYFINNYVWIADTDNEGLYKLTKYRIVGS